MDGQPAFGRMGRIGRISHLFFQKPFSPFTPFTFHLSPFTPHPFFPPLFPRPPLGIFASWRETTVRVFPEFLSSRLIPLFPLFPFPPLAPWREMAVAQTRAGRSLPLRGTPSVSICVHSWLTRLLAACLFFPSLLFPEFLINPPCSHGERSRTISAQPQRPTCGTTRRSLDRLHLRQGFHLR